MDEWEPARARIEIDPSRRKPYHWHCSGGPDGCHCGGDTFTRAEAMAEVADHMHIHYPSVVG